MASKSVFYLLLVVCFAALVNAQSRPLLGGLEDEKKADDEIRSVVDKVVNEIQEKYPEKFVKIEPISYRTQIVAGKNYFVKALVEEQDGDKNYAHLRIYKSFRGPVELGSIKTNVPRDGELKYFS